MRYNQNSTDVPLTLINKWTLHYIAYQHKPITLYASGLILSANAYNPSLLCKWWSPLFND